MLTVDGSGNVPPALAICVELVARGHTVRVLASARQVGDLAGRGLEVAAYRHAFPWSGQQRRSSTRAALDFARLVGDRRVGRDLADAHAERPADVVVVDAMIPGALIAARRLAIPAVALMHTFAAFFLGAPMETAGRLRGFSPRAQWSQARTLVVCDRELDPAGTHAGAAGYLWTGVAEAAPRALAAPVPLGGSPEPMVLVSLSSVHIPSQLGMLRRILVALEGLPVRVVVTTGPTIDPAALEPPPNAEIHRYVPHYDVMPAASLVIGHGGHSTAMRALMHGLPMLVLPADPRIDQGMIGGAGARSGAGLCLPRTARPKAIGAAVVEILTDARYAEAAAVVGTRLRAAQGVASAASHIESLARAGADHTGS